MKWWVPIVASLATLATSVLYGHAWILSEYLIHPVSYPDLFPSRRTSPPHLKFTIGPYLAKRGLEAETVTFPSLDDKNNPSRGATVVGWLIKAENSRAGVVLVHDGGADSRQMLPLVKVWLSYRVNVLMIQTQEAEDARTYLGMVAQYDVLAAVDMLQSKTNSPKVLVMGIAEGAAAALFAAQKSMAVDAVVAVNMHSESDELMQARADALIQDLQSVQSVSSEHPALKAVHTSGLMFLEQSWLTPTISTLASHIAVIRSSNWLVWLHGHSDPLKGIHRIQPRGLFLVQGKLSNINPATRVTPIHKLYHRAGECEPKLAHFPDVHVDPVTLSQDGKFASALGKFLQEL